MKQLTPTFLNLLLAFMLFFTSFYTSQAQEKQSSLHGNWSLRKYELKGKDQQMHFLFDNNNIDSSFQVLVASSDTTYHPDSLSQLKKEYKSQVDYLSDCYWKFTPDGKCKYSVMNDKGKFKKTTGTYTVKNDHLLLDDGTDYTILVLTPVELQLLSSNGKQKLTYKKQ